MVKSGGDSDRSQALNSAYTHVNTVNEWLVANNILFRLKFTDPGAIQNSVKLLNAAMRELPEKRKQLDALLGDATINAMTNGFGTRKIEIHAKRRFAFVGLLITLGVAAFAVGFLFFWKPLPGADANAGPWIEYVSLRIVTLFPVYLAVRFFWTEHARERQLEEDYGFRQAVCGSLTVLAGTIANDDTKHEVIKSTLDRVFTPIDKHQTEPVEAEVILKEVRKTIKAFKGVGAE